MKDYKRIRVLFSDHLGLARGKYQPKNTAAGGEAKFCISLYGLTYDKQLLPAPGSGLLEGLPDVVAKYKKEDILPSWEADTGIVIPDIEFNGEPLAHCGRNVLKKTITQFEKIGLTPYVGIELEAYVFEKDNDGNWVPYNTPGAYVYGTGAKVDPAGLIDEVWLQAEACGIELESFNSEFDSPQFELTLKYGKALEAVDQIFLFKTMAKEIFEQEETPTNVRIVINETKRPSSEHSRRYNRPLSDEIGILMPNDATSNRDIVLHYRDGGLKHILELHRSYV